MSKNLYCWRCRMTFPMLDESEFARVQPLLRQSLENVKKYRELKAASLAEALARAPQQMSRLADSRPPDTFC